jgi:hypothetical protein
MFIQALRQFSDTFSTFDPQSQRSQSMSGLSMRRSRSAYRHTAVGIKPASEEPEIEWTALQTLATDDG